MTTINEQAELFPLAEHLTDEDSESFTVLAMRGEMLYQLALRQTTRKRYAERFGHDPLEHSLELSSRAHTIHPENVRVLNNIGRAHLEMGKLEQAASTFEQARKIEPRQPMVLNNLGAIYRRMKEYEAAEKILRLAVEIGPSNPIPRVNLARVLRIRRKYKEAETELLMAKAISERSHGRASSPAPYISLGNLHSEAGATDRAEENYRTAIEIDPRADEALMKLGRIYFLSGRLRETAMTMEQLLSYQPDNLGAG